MSEETVKTAWVDENGKHLTSGHTENYPTPEELRESFGRGLTCGIIEAAHRCGLRVLVFWLHSTLPSRRIPYQYGCTLDAMPKAALCCRSFCITPHLPCDGSEPIPVELVNVIGYV